MTLVSFAHDFVYLRTRKTASTSTEMYLQPFCMPPGHEVTEFNPRQIISEFGIVGRRLGNAPVPAWKRFELTARRHLGLRNWTPHMTAQQVRDWLEPAFWNRALKISSVRNPFARVVSEFYWEIEKDGAPPEQDAAALIRRFRRRIRKGRFQDDRDIVMIDGHFVPDVLIRQEYIADDLAALVERLGLDPSKTSLPVTKKTKSSEAAARPPLADFYNDETAEILRARYAWAFEHGNYSPEVPR
jgi:hypothetical protein